MLGAAATGCRPAASEICFEPGCLLLVGHVREHAGCSIAVVTSDNETASRGQVLNHSPEGIRGQLLLGFMAELLETVARLGKLVDTLVEPVMTKKDGRRGGDPVKGVVPRSIQAFRARARKKVGGACSVV